MILNANVFHTHFSLNHNSYFLHDLTEFVPKRKLGQGNKLNGKHELTIFLFQNA